MQEKYIYVVISQTGTLMSKVIQGSTKSKYCHSSISLQPSLETMYSFGRRYMFTPLFGGYIKESPDGGIFKRYPKTEVVVLRFLVTEKCYAEIKTYLEEMYENKKRHKYNYIGAFLATFGKKFHRKRNFYCSEFVRDTLLKFEVCPKNSMPEVVIPSDFLKAFDDKKVYSGDLHEYTQLAS